MPQRHFRPALLAISLCVGIGVFFTGSLLNAQSGTSSTYIADDAGTLVPVYDTAWQMLILASPEEADEYFATLQEYGFTGTWAGVVHHKPATHNHRFYGGGTVATIDESGNVVLTPEYVDHVNEILDAADRYGRKVGLVAAWQNLYLPGAELDLGEETSDSVRGSVNESNAYAYGVQLVEAFGDHPAVSMWVFGGDAGTNNTEANKQVWRNMADGVRDAGSTLDITYHTPTSHGDQLNYAGEEWLDFISPETGHQQDADETESELLAAAEAYQLPVWQGEPRYFNIEGGWIDEEFQRPDVADVEADAIAARNAGVVGYVYGDAGRWNWCGGFDDASPCESENIAESFGAGEEAVINVFNAPGEESVPGEESPIDQVPVATVPETTVPPTTVPETTVPPTTVPETTVPAETTPAEEPSAESGLLIVEVPVESEEEVIEDLRDEAAEITVEVGTSATLEASGAN